MHRNHERHLWNSEKKSKKLTAESKDSTLLESIFALSKIYATP
jgi:hypothetical protein